MWGDFNNLAAIDMSFEEIDIVRSNGSDTSSCKANIQIPSKNHIILLTDGDSTYDQNLTPVALSNYSGHHNTSKSFIIDVAKALYDIDFRPGDDEKSKGLQNIITHFIAFGKGIGKPDILEKAAAASGGIFATATTSKSLTGSE